MFAGMEEDKQLGLRLKLLRERSGLSQRGLAKATAF